MGEIPETKNKKESIENLVVLPHSIVHLIQLFTSQEKTCIS